MVQPTSSLLKPAWSPWAEVREDLGYGVQERGIFEGFAQRDLILPAGPSPSSPMGLQGPAIPDNQEQGPALRIAIIFFLSNLTIWKLGFGRKNCANYENLEIAARNHTSHI